MMLAATTTKMPSFGGGGHHGGGGGRGWSGGGPKPTLRNMNRGEWLRSGFLIVVLIIVAILVAQSRRNCEIPGSTWVPCIWGEPLKHQR